MMASVVAMFERMKMLNEWWMREHDCDDRPVPSATFVLDDGQAYLLTQCEYRFTVDAVLNGDMARAIADMDASIWRLEYLILDVPADKNEDNRDRARAILKAEVAKHKFAKFDEWP